nr:hypothetical protein [Tanacetum cinerariifolium]
MTDHVQEQEMEIEALEAILMDEFSEIQPFESGLNTSNRCFQITLSPQDDDMDEASTTPVQLGLIFSHTEKYPDEIPLLNVNVRSIRGIHTSDLKVLKEKLEQEASENLGMAMIYTLVSSAKDWLTELFAQDNADDNDEEEVAKKDEYLATKESQDVPTEASPIPPTAAYMLKTLTDLTTQVEGHRKVNQEQALVNDTLSVELDQCKLELAKLERNKVKLECDQVIVARNKRNDELEQETELLKTTLRNKEATIASLTSETKTVLSEKKTLEDKYLEEIVCLKNDNQVATGLLQKFQMPTQTIPMLSKRPMIASNGIHKAGLGLSNPWFGRKAQLSQPTLYDGHRLLQPVHAPVVVSDSHETLLETEFSRMKMYQKSGHVTPVDYTKLNALYDQFVPQKNSPENRFIGFLPLILLANLKGAAIEEDGSDEEDEDFDFDDDEDFEENTKVLFHLSRFRHCHFSVHPDDEDDMLEHYLAEKDSSAHSSSVAN